MTKPLPNWDIWLHMPTLTTHQAVCLSFGLDPSKVHAYDHKEKSWGWLGNRLFNAVSDFNDRRTLFSACHPKGLSPEQLSKWAQSVNWNIPTMLADLAPVPVDAPDTLPAETVRAALVEVIGPGADIEELKKEIERTGITFSMRDGVETMEVPDGNLRGRRTPLSGLYNELRTIFYTMPKGSKLGSLMRASGASGGGTQPSYGLSHTPQKLAQTTAIPEPQQTAPATDTAMPAPVVAVGASGGVEHTKAGPLPLTTGDIAYCFAGLRWPTEERWKKPLGDKPKWLAACVAIPAVRGVSEARWSPVCIGAALVRDGHVKANNVRAKFQTMPLLTPWLDEWKTYEADNFDSN